MTKLPKVVGIVLCEGLEFPPPARIPCLIGIFLSLRFKRFPSPPANFTAYFALHNGIGEGIIELAIGRMETEEDIFTTKEEIYLPGRAMHRHCLLKVRSCRFPAPGNYGLSIRFKGEGQEVGEELARRYLEIFSDQEVK